MRLLLLVLANWVIGAAAFGSTRVGEPVDSFRSALGPPSHEDILGRTMILEWRGPAVTKNPIAPDISGIKADFLDRRACAITLQIRRSVSAPYLLRTIQPFLQSVSKLPRPTTHAKAYTLYYLPDGSAVTVSNDPIRSTIAILGRDYRRNLELFDREAARVHPPTSNH
jgi:hypothetical protein